MLEDWGEERLNAIKEALIPPSGPLPAAVKHQSRQAERRESFQAQSLKLFWTLGQLKPSNLVMFAAI